MMKFAIHERYLGAIETLVEAGLYENKEEALEGVLWQGVMEAQSDLDLLEGTPHPQPDISFDFSQGETISIVVPDRWKAHLDFVSKGFDLPSMEASKVVYIYGISQHYFELSHCQLYSKNPTFRSKVHELPHELDDEH